MRATPRRAKVRLGGLGPALALALSGCDPGVEAAPAAGGASSVPLVTVAPSAPSAPASPIGPREPGEAGGALVPADEVTLAATRGPERAAAPPEEEVEATPPTAAATLGSFVSERTTVVYAEPRWGSALRGRVDPGDPFEAIGRARGEGCEDGGWVKVALGGFVCLRHAVATAAPPRMQPPLAEGAILPFIYAKPRADRKGALLAEVPRYPSARALLSGGKAVDSLVAHRQYAFVEVIKRPSVGDVLVDRDGQAVPGRDMVIQRPSELHGRSLAEAPVPAGLTAAWSVSLPALVYDGAGKKAKAIGGVAYHERLEVDPAVIAGPGGLRLLRAPGLGKEGADGFVDASQVRFWVPGPAMTAVGEDEVWIDVDVDQQMLGLRRGPEEVLFLTLVSTGTGKHPTPRGIFRIRNKLALGKMENRPDEPESYYVEEVPWVQYFYKRFAFHTAYWHRSLGRRRSHGCINLAPRDAIFLFGQTSPPLPPGWTSVFEHAGATGTTVRVRKGDDPLPDRRRPLGAPEEEGDEDEPPEAGASDEAEDAP